MELSLAGGTVHRWGAPGRAAGHPGCVGQGGQGATGDRVFCGCCSPYLSLGTGRACCTHLSAPKGHGWEQQFDTVQASACIVLCLSSTFETLSLSTPTGACTDATCTQENISISCHFHERIVRTFRSERLGS